MAKLAILLLGGLLVMPASAAAQPQSDFTAAVVTSGNKCLIPDTKRELRVFDCSQGGARYWISNGVVRTKDGYCWDHGIPKGVAFSGRTAVHLVPCHGGRSQIWYFIRDGRALVQNAANDEACITIEGDRAGALAVVAKCTFREPIETVQKFYVGETLTERGRQVLTQVASTSTLSQFQARGSAVQNNTRMVAAGGGNIIVAPGMVAAGGGNVLPSGAGNMVAAGGGNLLGNDGGSLRAALGNK